MKRLTSLILTLAMTLSLCASMFTVVEGKSLSALPKVPLNYMNEDSDWKGATETTCTSPMAFQGALPTTNFEVNTKVMGGNSADPVSAAKAEDDVYFKLENVSKTTRTDNYVEILTAKTPTIDRYVLGTGDENVITISMDFATSNVSTGDSKNLFACETNASVTSGSSNKWELAAGVTTTGYFGTGTVENNTWYNVTYEIGGTDAKSVKYFLNGVQVGTQTLTNANLGLVRTGAQANSGNVNTIYYDNVYVNVGEPYSTARYLANRDAAALNFAHFKGSNTAKNNVLTHLDLNGNFDGFDEETMISWASSNNSVINPTTGAVTQDILDTNVKLTATIKNGGKSNTKEFNVTVPARAADPQDVLDARNDLSALVNANISKNADPYTAASFEAFSTALTAAQATIGNSSATVGDLLTATTNLVGRVNGLMIQRPDTSGIITQDTYYEIGALAGNPQSGRNYGAKVDLVAKGTKSTGDSTSRVIFIESDITGIDSDSTNVVLKLFNISSPIDVWPLNLYRVSEKFAGAFVAGTGIGDAQALAGEFTYNLRNNVITMEALESQCQQSSLTALGYVSFDITNYFKDAIAAGKNKIIMAIDTSRPGNAATGGSATFGGSGIAFHSKEATGDNAAKVPVVTGKTEFTLAQLKNSDLNAIDITKYINDPSVDLISQSLKALPEIGAKNGYAITWKSSNKAVMSDSGVVTMPSITTPVTMTATINADGVTHSRDFNLTVKVMSDIEKDYNALTFDSIKGTNQSPTNVSYKLNLITTGMNGSSISWTSDNEAVIAADGKVTIDALANAKDVKLTATIGVAPEQLTKQFDLRVGGDYYVYDDAKTMSVPEAKSAQMSVVFDERWRISGWRMTNGATNQYLVYKAPESGSFIIDTVVNTTERMLIETSADNISYTSFTGFSIGDSEPRDPGYFGGYETVKYTSNQPLPAGTKFIKLKIPNTTSGWQHTVSEVRITAPNTDITFNDIKAANVDSKMVISSLALPDTFGGANILWSNNGSEVIANNGIISARPAADTVVKLTATITRGAAVSVRNFNFTVKAYADKLSTIDRPFVYYNSTKNGKPAKSDIYVGTTSGLGTTLYSYVDLVNITNSSKDIALVLAVYSKSGVLLDISFEEITVDNTSGAPQRMQTSVTLNNDTADIYKGSTIKSFVWDLNYLYPISEKFSITRTDS